MKTCLSPIPAASHPLLGWVRTAALGVLTCSVSFPASGYSPAVRTGGSPASTLTGVTFLDGLYVAVGFDGTLLTRVPGGAWKQRVSGVEIRLNAVARGAGWWVVVGDGGTVLISRDEVHWERCFAGIAEDLKGIVHARGRFVAVGANGTIVVSSDARHWEPRNSGVTTELRSLADDGRHWVAVGASRTLLISEDGDAWTKSLPSACPGFHQVIAAREAFWTAGCDGLIRSTRDEGGAWSHGLFAKVGPIYAVAAGPHGYVAAGAHGAIFASPDGRLWMPCPWVTSRQLWGMASGPDGFVAVGSGGIAFHSGDGRMWRRTTIEWLPRTMAVARSRSNGM